MRRLRPALRVAAPVGALLGGREVVLGTVPSQPQPLEGMNAPSRQHAGFPATRPEAVERLRDFLPGCAAYAARRNHVEPGHRNVSRLSPALRTRVLLEREVCAAVLDRFPGSEAEKFIQEVWWRLYWKGWMEMRPAVWTRYRRKLESIPEETRTRSRKIEEGESGVAIMDHFARELVATGYLHNHARMWFASFWVHAENLPWELGADFFMRHLLDGDAASNTLSWRWVAGLHTPGKTYLVSRANIERCCHPELLSGNEKGLDRLENISPQAPGDPGGANPPPQSFPAAPLDPGDVTGRWGLWVHADDLTPERSELASLRPAAIRAWLPEARTGETGISPSVLEHRSRAIADAIDRAGAHFGAKSACSRTDDLGSAMAAWAEEDKLDTIVALRPFVGPLGDALEVIRPRLDAVGCRLVLVRRAIDAEAMRFATGGFFGFWKKTGPLRQGSRGRTAPKASPSTE